MGVERGQVAMGVSAGVSDEVQAQRVPERPLKLPGVSVSDRFDKRLHSLASAFIGALNSRQGTLAAGLTGEPYSPARRMSQCCWCSCGAKDARRERARR